MAFDNLVFERIAGDIDEAVRDAFMDVPFALGVNQYALPFHAAENLKERSSGRGVIILCLDPSRPFVSLGLDKYAKAVDNTPFFNSLRKIAGQRFVSCTKRRGERVITLSFRRVKRELGDLDDGCDLAVELFPSRSNAFLISQPSGLILSLFKERGDITSARFLTRNTRYVYPPERRVFDSSVNSLEEAKPLLSKDVFRRLEKRSQEVGFERAKDELLSDGGLYFAEGTILPARLGQDDCEPVRTEDIYSRFVTDQKAQSRSLKERDLTARVDRALKTAERKLKNLQDDYRASEQRMVYADWGNLLFLYQTEYQPKSTSMTVEGITIPLDPKLDVIQNANLYFRKYRKAKLALTTLKRLEGETQDEIDYLRKKAMEIPKASNRDLVELKAELVMEGYLKDPSRKYRTKRSKAYQPHMVTTESGTRIGFGANGLQNEYLTFEMAGPEDLFFHVKDYPGAHVIILDGRREDETQLLAAELALWLSGLEDGDVMVTPRKRVKKNPRRTGLVSILSYDTIHVSRIRPESIELFKQASKG